ncbi:hypothetical protein [Stenotrophomonas sp. 278]|uniref:hypothetical protein n=1 Tax=Stenotrophomonas sp. 278 TaxID=2479851 RepID=UPI000F686BFB|nr:hypothetical protein [Stenotrophomonas sp. 278]
MSVHDSLNAACSLLYDSESGAAALDEDRYLKVGALEEVLKDDRPLDAPVSLVYLSPSYFAPQLRAFADWIQVNLGGAHPVWLRG